MAVWSSVDTGQIIGELLIRVARDTGCNWEDVSADIKLEPQHRVEYDAGAAEVDCWFVVPLVPRPVLVKTRVEATVHIAGTRRTTEYRAEIRAGEAGPYHWTARHTARKA